MAAAGETVHVVLIETGSNQAYVFQTNKLREIVGASELIHRAGTAWAMEAAADVGGPPVPADETSTARARYLLSAPKVGAGGAAVEPVVCTSGKAVFLVREKSVGEAIVWGVTSRALEAAPGLVVRGAVSEAIAFDASAAAVGAAVAHLFRRIEGLRLTLPPVEARFPLQPIVEPCPTTGLPIERTDRRGERISEVAYRKRRAFEASRARVYADLKAFGFSGDLPPTPDTLDTGMGLPWFGVVHADGNGFGEVFLNLARYVTGGATGLRGYMDLFRRLSVSLDLVGVAALARAASTLERVRPAGETTRFTPLLVNVMGGDDLSVICDGRQAVRFAKAHLDAFEAEVAAARIGDVDNVIPSLAAIRRRKGESGFGAAAGVAIVKPHHPLHRAYDLADDLTRSAKALVKTDLADAGLSALDFQVVFGDATSDLDDLRAPWVDDDPAPADRGPDGADRVQAHARPYVTSTRTDTAAPGIASRHIDRLFSAAAEVRRRDEDGRALLPRKQQHELRDAVLDGIALADARLTLMSHRYQSKGIDWPVFGGSPDTLYWTWSGRTKRVRLTRLLDAMDLADIEPDAAPADEPATEEATA